MVCVCVSMVCVCVCVYVCVRAYIDGRKFDVRCWVLLDSLYRIHVFEDGSSVAAFACLLHALLQL